MQEVSQDRICALALLSGGLDSMLAVCVLREQGIQVEAVCFESPFFDAVRAEEAARQIRIPLHVVDFTADIVAIVEHPKHGFGSGMNPCIDCHAAMIRRAGDMMKERGFHFVSTGEVLDQRPMSQNRRSLAIVAEESGYAGFLVRPLSARLLPETEPERRQWVDRNRLLAISGRNRKPQFGLAARYGIVNYIAGTGGCRLTEPNYSARLRDLRKHEGVRDPGAVRLLRLGRHFRLDPSVKLVVGRNRADNGIIERVAAPEDIVLKPEGGAGPTCWLPPSAGPEHVRLAAGICARYTDGPSDEPVGIVVRAGPETRRVDVERAGNELVEKLRIN